MKGLTLEPNADNTQLLYDNPDLGLRFLYPRRWRVAGDLGQQVRLDGTDGSGVLMTLEPPARVPSAAQFLEESEKWFASQKGYKVLRSEAPQRVQTAPGPWTISPWRSIPGDSRCSWTITWSTRRRAE